MKEDLEKLKITCQVLDDHVQLLIERLQSIEGRLAYLERKQGVAGGFPYED